MLDVICPICKKTNKYHLLEHLKDEHNMLLEEYLAQYPDDPYLSNQMYKMMNELNIKRTPVSSYAQMSVEMGDKKVILPFNFKIGGMYVPALDPDYIFMKSMYYIYEGIKTDHVYIYGETGLGKTDGVYQLAALLNQPIRELNMSGETTPENFLGYLTATEGTIHFQKGILLDCMEKGYWLLLDEIDYGNPNILSILNNVMQFGFIYVPEIKERVYAHPDFRVIGTANTAGTGDEVGFYQGTNRLNRALIDRFGTCVEFEFPTVAELSLIIEKKVGKLKDMSSFVQFVFEMRKAVTSNQIYMPFGIRSAIKFAKKLKAEKFNCWEAACISFANMTDTHSREVIKNILQKCFGTW